MSEDERIEIADLVQVGEGVRAIARRLGPKPRRIRRGTALHDLRGRRIETPLEPRTDQPAHAPRLPR